MRSEQGESRRGRTEADVIHGKGVPDAHRIQQVGIKRLHGKIIKA
jgi:hypothetical protein